MKFLAVISLFATWPLAFSQERPDVVVFLADDLSFRDCSVYGSKEAITPNVRRLAREGMTFNRAYVASPTCAPSRAALLTGLMPARSGAESNPSLPEANLKMLPARLQEHGYEVVAFGKVSHYGDASFFGFDHFAHDGYDHFTDSEFDEKVVVPDTVRWLRGRKRDAPLCLFVGSNWPHVPWPRTPRTPLPERIALPPRHVDTPETRFDRSRYLKAVKKMDTSLGIVYDAAQQALGDNLLFLFTSDHGAHWPFAKWTCYEAGIRVPLIAVWPGRIAAGVRTDAMASWIDILPTLLEFAGEAAPEDIDGRSFAQVLLGNKTSHRNRIFATHSNNGNINVYPIRSLRKANWKYILNLYSQFAFTSHIDQAMTRDRPDYFKSWWRAARSSPSAAEILRDYYARPLEELYDLSSDPHEMRNLADDPRYEGQLESMRSQVRVWMNANGDVGAVHGNPRMLSDTPWPSEMTPIVLTDESTR